MDEGSKKGGNPHIDPNIILDPMKVDLVSIRTSYSHQIEPDDIQSADDIEDLLSEMHDFAEHEFRYYWLKESEFNSFISAAEQRGAIVSSEWEFCHYRHPSFRGPNYTRIIERENGYASDWHREVAEKGPMYLRTILSLSERERRRRDLADVDRKVTPKDQSPIILKPTIYGMGIDVPATVKWFKSSRVEEPGYQP
jgi:hypothetical protein